MWNMVIRYAIARLKEKSTIVTIVTGILGAIGINIAPGMHDLIVNAVIAILATIGIVTREK
ncbi:MAG: hypothetical protein [Arizlama microvirus]|nr:MAG: hypothetical protein [Arizlama microvirus]